MDELRPIDIAPSLYTMCRCLFPRIWKGRVVPETFEPEYLHDHGIGRGCPMEEATVGKITKLGDDEGVILETLRALGYIECSSETLRRAINPRLGSDTERVSSLTRM